MAWQAGLLWRVAFCRRQEAGERFGGGAVEWRPASAGMGLDGERYRTASLARVSKLVSGKDLRHFEGYVPGSWAGLAWHL